MEEKEYILQILPFLTKSLHQFLMVPFPKCKVADFIGRRALLSFFWPANGTFFK